MFLLMQAAELSGPEFCHIRVSLISVCESKDKGNRNRHGKDSDKIRNPHPLGSRFPIMEQFSYIPLYY